MADVRTALNAAAAYLGDMRRTKDDPDGADFRRHLDSFLGNVQTSLYRMEYEAEQRGSAGDDGLADWIKQELQSRGFAWRDKNPATTKRRRVWGTAHPGADALLDMLSRERHVAVHRRDIRLRQHVDIGVATRVQSSVSVTIQITRADGTVEAPISSVPVPPAPEPLTSESETTWWRRDWFFDEPPQDEVTSCCERALTEFTKLVGAYETLGGT